MATAAGTLTGWRKAAADAKDKHATAVFTCARCKREGCEARMDHYLDRDQSCGCLKDANVGKMIETIIESIPENVQESISKELELGKRSPYPTLGELAVHFNLFGTFARFAMMRMRKRWAESEWLRLGQKRMEAIWRSVQKVGIRATAKRFFQQTCTVLVACRWVRTYSPTYSTLQTA